jgi:hypothetical protein
MSMWLTRRCGSKPGFSASQEARLIAFSYGLLCCYFETDDSSYDQANTGKPYYINGFMERCHAEQGSADRPHTGPDGISGAERQASQRHPLAGRG